MRIRTSIAPSVLGLAALTLMASPAPEAAVTSTSLLQDQRDEVALELINKGTHQRLGLPDFLVAGAEPDLAGVAKTMADVLWNDLDFEREYYMVRRQDSASIPLAPADALPLAQWAEIADFVLVGDVNRNGGDIIVRLRLISVAGRQQGQQTWGVEFQNCRPQSPRACAHAIADRFHKETKRLDGVAQTKLAFASDRGGTTVAGRPSQTAGTGKEIYISDYDGAGQLRLTVNRSLNMQPSWSPTGGLLAYVSLIDSPWDIYVANLAEPGRALTRPAAGNAEVQNLYPAWSPDGSKLAFASTRSGNFDIWVVNRDGSGLQNLTPNSPASEGSPTWSPNGTQIAFTSDRLGGSNNPQLFVMSANGTDQRRLLADRIDRPTWSTQNFIAFTLGQSVGNNIAIYDFNNPGGGAKVLTDGIGTNESPAVAPNGRHIAFVTTRWGRQEIATIDRTGTNIRRVTQVGNNTYPNWQPITGR